MTSYQEYWARRRIQFQLEREFFRLLGPDWQRWITPKEI